MERLLVVGPGRIGLALGYALRQAEGVRHLVYCGRRPDPPSHPLFGQGLAEYHFGLMAPPPGTDAVVLAVPDDVLPEMAHALAAQGRPGPGAVALHTSGALSTEVLAPLHAAGYAVGSIHPLQAVAHPVTGADRLRGAGYAVAGEPAARRVARAIVHALAGEILEIPVARRPLYHAAAVLASNGLAGLMAVAADLLVRAGAEPDRAVACLVSLARGALDDVESEGLHPGLTGPVVRGDVDTVDLHLRALEGDAREEYRALSRVLAEVAEARGVDPDRVGALRSLLQAPPGVPNEEST
ncbi:MAG: DUF2520 domain-containing protein [Longimicrobiales bacterium]